MTVVDWPWFTDEAMVTTFDRPDRAFSIGRATWVSISAGAAPLRVTETETAGNSTLGKFLIGSWV